MVLFLLLYNGEHSVDVFIHWVFTYNSNSYGGFNDVVVDFSLEVDPTSRMTALEVLASADETTLWAYTMLGKKKWK